MQPALHDDQMERVLDSANVRRAWKRVKANKGAPGVDGLRIEDFAEFTRSNWPDIRQALCDGSYQPLFAPIGELCHLLGCVPAPEIR